MVFLVLLVACSSGYRCPDPIISGADLTEEFESGGPQVGVPSDGVVDEACQGLSHAYEYHYYGSPDSGFQHRVAIHALALSFMADDPTEPPSALDPLDTSGLACSIAPVIGFDCGFAADTEPPAVVTDRDGVTITYETAEFLKDSPLGLVWRYDSESPGSRENAPMLSGPTTAGATESYRMSTFLPFVEGVVGSDVRTAAYILVEHMFAELDASDDSFEGWCPNYGGSVDPETDDPDADYVYWYPLATHTTGVVECQTSKSAR